MTLYEEIICSFCKSHPDYYGFCSECGNVKGKVRESLKRIVDNEDIIDKTGKWILDYKEREEEEPSKLSIVLKVKNICSECGVEINSIMHKCNIFRKNRGFRK